MTEQYEAVVIGTGFGGAICACRLSKKWPGGKVLVLERGKRYPMGSFPRSPHEMAQSFWNVPEEKRRHPKKLQPKKMRRENSLGLFDIRMFKRMDVVLGAGLGGGSLIYANVFMEPPDNVFDDRWPEPCKKRYLEPYYRIAKEVLGARTIPRNGDPRRAIVRTELFEKVASQIGRKSELVDINVFFGNDFADPLPMGHQQKNRYGAPQTSCLYCAECNVGCNYHSKNTLDLNYLFVAENCYAARIETEQRADKVVPLGRDGNEDPNADGSNGYHVHYQALTGSRQPKMVRTNRVVVSAGALGSTEMLLRCRDVYKTLPGVSRRLGYNFSGNGDFLSFVAGTDEPADPNYGPVITQRIDFNLFEKLDPQQPSFIVEDASYPAFASWFIEAAKPGFLNLKAYWRLLKHVAARFLCGRSMSHVGFALSDLLSNDLSYNTTVLLCMGLDSSDGVMTLDCHNRISVDWPQKTSRALYDLMLDAGKEFRRVSGAKWFLPMPTWLWPLRRNVTVHSLGGCVLSDNPERGVTSTDMATFGQVFGYEGLYVADGAIVPTAVGANPTATISALSEMVAESITGTKPDSNL